MMVLKNGQWKLKRGLFEKDRNNIGVIKLTEWKGVVDYEMEFIFLAENDDYVFGFKHTEMDNCYVPVKIAKDLIV